MEGTEKVAKRRYRKRKVPQVETTATSRHEPRMVMMKYLLGAAGEVRDNGTVTGQEYKFHPGGVTPVDERDVEGLLARQTNPKKPCCGRKVAAPQQMYGVV